ncbi:MAG: sigma-70 family RNA polymerase sigma factor [Halioglobus sp.]|nr:sigma-70 family RNA polymerase sigma factor [Halioglobus sp.]
MNTSPDAQAEVSTRSTSDLASLIRGIQARNRDAFGAFYDATIQRVYGLALRITRQRTLAEEVVGDVYLQVWQQAANYSPGRGTIVAWLSVICRSRALDALRRDGGHGRAISLDVGPAGESADSSAAPDDIVQSVEQGSQIHMALMLLSERQRQLVALAYFRGYTHSEIATCVRMPIGTVKVNLHRAMKTLKEFMTADKQTKGGRDE